MKNIFLIVLLFSLSNLYSQKGTITGKIIDFADKEPLIGVSIQVKGTTDGTVSDIGGKYSIDATANDILVFQFLAYEKQEIKVANQTVINIVMKEDLSTSTLPIVYDIKGTVRFSGLSTYSHHKIGYAFDIASRLPYTYSRRHDNSIYDKIKSNSSMGIKVNKTYPKDNYFQASLYFQYFAIKWNTNGYKVGKINLLPYVKMGLYINAHKSNIESQNLEYGVGITVRHLYYKYDRWALIAGYQGYNKLHKYNNIHLGIRYTLPPIVWSYE